MFQVLLGTQLGWVYAGPYSDRPNILNVPARKHERDKTWEKLKEGHVEAVAQILGMYPDHEIYFLARDGELLYDLAQVMTIQDSKKYGNDSKRIHLINVSRLNMHDPHLKDYLEQEGIREEDLKKGKKVLFVDTGFAGTIPKTILQRYSADARKQFQTQLLCSSNSNHPSSRTFLMSLNRSAAQAHPSQMHKSIISYEHRPRYTHRSNEFRKIGNRWIPWALDDGSSEDGEVNSQEAKKDLEDLKFYAQSGVAQRLFTKRRQFWGNLRDALENKNSEQASQLLHEEMRSKDPKSEAISRDAIEITRTNFPKLSPSLPAMKDLGLAEITTTVYGNKLKLIQKYPEWKPYLEDPKTGIEALISKKDFQTLHAMADVIEDHEFMETLAQHLAEPDPVLHATLLAWIDGGKNLSHIARATFSKPGSAQLTKELKSLIQKGDKDTLQNLAKEAFSKPHSKAWKGELKLLIERGDKDILQNLAHYAFSQPHSVEWGDELKLLIQKGDKVTRHYLAQYTFSQPHSVAWRDELRILIKRGWQLNNFSDVFSQPHSMEWRDELKLLIEKGDKAASRGLAHSVFSQPHSTAWKDELKIFIKKGDKEVLDLLQGSLKKLQTKIYDPSLEIYIEACQIGDSKKRVKFIEDRLKLHSTSSQSCNRF